MVLGVGRHGEAEAEVPLQVFPGPVGLGGAPDGVPSGAVRCDGVFEGDEARVRGDAWGEKVGGDVVQPTVAFLVTPDPGGVDCVFVYCEEGEGVGVGDGADGEESGGV